MIYYLENGNDIKINDDLINRINRGSSSSVYRMNNDECVKLYYLDAAFKIEHDIFDIMKSLDLVNFCKLHDLIFDKNRNLTGYTMKYYDKINENILLIEKDYILDNFNSLYNSFIKLSTNRIVANDLWFKNCVIGNDITIIDFDYYDFSNLSIDEIKEINTSKLLLLFNKIFNYYLGLLNDEVSLHTSDLLDDIFSYSTNPAKRLNKVFEGYKRPIDLVNSLN